MNGQVKCPKCGATDISTNPNTGQLRCNYCRFEFAAEAALSINDDIFQMEGLKIGAGAQDIVPDVSEIVTMKCESCGAEVVINTAESTQARCHWCRNYLSLNQQLPNGAVPDALLPFNVRKQEAEAEIDRFVKQRRFFAHPQFLKEFSSENVNGVFLPYMVVDVNAHARFEGYGEITTATYQRKIDDDDYETVYDVDRYRVDRDFDIAIDNLTVEANTERADFSSEDETNNIINALMPFDVENAVTYDSNYLRGFTSERRNTEVGQLQGLVDQQAKDVARYAARETIDRYDRGVAWENEEFSVKGQTWNCAYLPVWLYSYLQTSGSKKTVHYVAVNARTRKTMGSVPLNMARLVFTSILVEIIGFIPGLLILLGFFGRDHHEVGLLFLLIGVVFFWYYYSKYRNPDARHVYELETRRQVANLKVIDDYQAHYTGVEELEIRHRNDDSLAGNRIGGNSWF